MDSYSSPVKRKVLGDIINKAESPISPTANLKLLTKVASQFDSRFNSSVLGTPTLKSDPIKLNLHGKGVRKFKSLGFLCDKFLKLYPLEVPDHMHSHILLSDLANQLGVEKRRIYDIINVVESLQMATKVGKNSYTWTGHKKLVDTLSQLKAYAEQIGLVQYVRAEQLKRRLYLGLHKEDTESTENCAFVENSNIASFFRNERRIGILCQKFVMLFLISLTDGVINLELASQVLVGESQQNKTRLRRLYDIANILVSLGIINKLDLGSKWKKPVFQYAGPTLQKIENISYENPIISSLVKAELSDSISSDLSEDSNELCCKSQGNGQSSSTMPESDHSYSREVMKPPDNAGSGLEPTAKKRLVFTSDSSNKVVMQNSTSFKLTPAPSALAQQSLKPRILRVVGQVSVPQPITNGGVYKAVRIGNSITLIRIDKS